MDQLTIDLPEDVLVATGQTREGFVQEAKFLLAAKLFELGRLSSGRAAGLCDLDRVTFLLSLHRVGVPVLDLDMAEMEEEFRYAGGELSIRGPVASGCAWRRSARRAKADRKGVGPYFACWARLSTSR